MPALKLSPAITPIPRRTLLAGSVAASIAAALGSLTMRHGLAQDTDLVDEVVIDLEVEPPSLDPALGNDLNAWSVVHALHDSLVNIGSDGEAQPLLAESIEFPDPLTCRIVLRAGSLHLAIGRRRQTAPLRPFLQLRLRIAPFRVRPF